VSLRDRNFVEQIYASGTACVEMSSGFGNRLVHPDNHGGAAAAVNHLVERGHRRIAHWPGGIAGNHASEQRLRGFLDASARHGLRPEDVLIVKSADAVAERLRRPLRERPTAIFAFNDYQAFMTLDIARSLGLRVPADLSLVGFDDSILAQAARPMLTTVYNPLREQAEAAINVLQALWRGETDLPIPPAVPTRLVVRESTAAAPVPAPTPHPLDEEK
jgi:LacI family transcriptional regulator